jgi:hypothetical protein
MSLLIFISIASPLIRQHKTYNLPVHKTLYLDRRIYDDQFLHIMSAALEWNTATNGQVVFDIKRLPQNNIDSASSVLIMNATPDSPDVILLDQHNFYSTLALTNPNYTINYIALVDERINDKYYDAAVMHELGHALGLEHLKGDENIGTLMYPMVDLGSVHITDTDLLYFCKLYNCDSSKFHGLPQIQ